MSVVFVYNDFGIGGTYKSHYLFCRVLLINWEENDGVWETNGEFEDEIEEVPENEGIIRQDWEERKHESGD